MTPVPYDVVLYYYVVPVRILILGASTPPEISAPLSQSPAAWSAGTTGVKTTAELLEQVDRDAVLVGSAVGITRAAVRRRTSKTRDVVYSPSQVLGSEPNSTLGQRLV